MELCGVTESNETGLLITSVFQIESFSLGDEDAVQDLCEENTISLQEIKQENEEMLTKEETDVPDSVEMDVDNKDSETEDENEDQPFGLAEENLFNLDGDRYYRVNCDKLLLASHNIQPCWVVMDRLDDAEVDLESLMDQVNRCLSCGVVKEGHFSTDAVFKRICNWCFDQRYEKMFQGCVENIRSCNACLDACEDNGPQTVYDCSRDDVFECYYCAMVFKDKSEITNHVMLRSKKICYVCKEVFCNKLGFTSIRFSLRSQLNKHIKSHTRKEALMCHYCSKGFIYKSDLTRHIRTHTKEKPFKCNFCSKCFSQKSHLTNHIRTHTKEKPFKCNFCSKCFSVKSSLIGHIRTHTKEKPFKCNFCSKCFREKTHLTNHIRTHTKEKPFKCNFCSKCFSRRSNLIYHIRTHTKGKPFKCNFCSKCFRQRTHLTYHIPTHNKEKLK